FFFFSSRRRHTRFSRDWSSDVCSSDLAKPVMEGKGCLFKKFAGIDVFDIELAETDPEKLVEIIAALEPTLGGINLEDIKAPECRSEERRVGKEWRERWSTRE